VSAHQRLTRRSALLGAAGAAVTGGARRLGCAAAGQTPAVAGASQPPLWLTAAQRGLVYGTAMSTRLLADEAYTRLVHREAALLLTEDDLLWYKLKPTPDADLDFRDGDRFMAFAEQRRKRVLGAHLVWDDGFGDGWTDDDLWGLAKAEARRLLLDTIDRVVGRYAGRVTGWIVVNEAVDAHEDGGLRRDVPWAQTIGPTYVAESFRAAHAADRDTLLVLNEFGFETDDPFGRAEDKRRQALLVLDRLLAADVPVHALGVQAHLAAANFADAFDPPGYRRFLADVAARGLTILITELDVLDDGLPADTAVRDRAVADAYRRYLEVALDEAAVTSVVTFGLSDRHTWLEEDDPRRDGVPRRPLPFDDHLRPKPAYHALADALANAERRRSLWRSGEPPLPDPAAVPQTESRA